MARIRLPLIVGIAVLAVAGTRGDQDPYREAIRRRIAALAVTDRTSVAGQTLRHPRAVLELYGSGDSAPLWSPAVEAVLRQALRQLAGDGLDPTSYHLAAVAATPAPTEPGRRADLDILRTDALVAALHDLRFGRTRSPPGGAPLAPAGVTRGEATARATGLAADEVRKLMRTPGLAAQLEAARPEHFAYRGLRQGLERLRDLRRAGGWDALPPGPSMGAGDRDVRVPALRRRLRVEGYAAAGGRDDDSTFDAALADVVRGFQHDHGLNEDGVVGPSTRAALNVPVEARIDQIRVNLERARWVLHDLPDTAVVVNIAGARAYLLHGATAAFEARAIVGQEYTRTPVFTATLLTVDLNPAWHVPPGIIGEVLGAARRSRGYLAREGIRVLDRSGRVVNPALIDFSRYSAATFPYGFRQDPGPRNPLGRVRFGLPNRYNVYLHDTPARELFEREDRTFSHGCVRVEDPVRLAALVLDDPAWTPPALEEAIASGRTRVIRLRTPVAVLVQYWTASADLHGDLHYYPDRYDRDPDLLAALDRP